jgi:hypothetical protein
MSRLQQMEAELRKLSPAELRQIRDWLDDLIEDDLQLLGRLGLNANGRYNFGVRQSHRL